jgi:two-component system response regulator GlrR
MNRSHQANRKVRAEPALTTLPQLPTPTQRSPGIQVTIVCAPQADALADSIEELLAEAKGFTCSRLECCAKSGLKPPAMGDPDVVVATLGAFEAKSTDTLLASVRRTFPDRSVVVTTTHPDTFDFFQVLEMGASDFLLPPVRSSELLARLKHHARALRCDDSVVQKLKEDMGLKHIIGESPAFLEKVRCIPRFAQCDATVLMSGESGTGKEVFARAIHYLSSRAGRPFVPVNCGALAENLVESEIFGHKRGAFTGAASDQHGLIGEAEGGTLFLDEIDCLTPQAQVKLLRFLQDGEYRSVGSHQVLRANIRVIAATNTDFKDIVRLGKFREDLFFRLNVLGLTLPPLRDRAGDIVLLAHAFLQNQATNENSRPKILSLPALSRLLSHSWPGNVRELQNVLMRAIVLSDHEMIEASDISLPDDGAVAEDQSFRTLKSQTVWRFEHDFLISVLRAHKGNITRAAFSVKKNRRAFWELLRKHDLLSEGQSRLT